MALGGSFSGMDGASILEEVERHPVCAPELLAHVPLTASELAASSSQFMAARSLASRAAVATPGWQRVREAIGSLGKSRFEAATELLARLWRHSLIIPLRGAAGHALFAIGTTDAHAALQSALRDAEPHGDLPTFLAIKSILATEPETAFDRLAPFFQPGGADRFVGGVALRIFAPLTLGRERTWHLPILPDLLRADRRWIRAAIGLRRDRELAGFARGLLSSLTPADIDAALLEWPDPAPQPAAPYVGPRDLLARYERGDTEAVWRWLREAGQITDEALREEARAVAEAAMRRVRRNVERITDRLRTNGYPFDDARAPWAAPSMETESAIARIEAATGGPAPTTLRAFWTVVGSVHWRFAEDGDDTWCGLPTMHADPLCLDGPAAAWWSIDEWQQEVRLSHLEIAGPAQVMLAPDHLHKANISGGAPYGFTLPTREVDPTFEHEEHALPFVEYLRLCLRWGGFPRLERVELSGEGSRTLEMLRADLEPF